MRWNNRVTSIPSKDCAFNYDFALNIDFETNRLLLFHSSSQLTKAPVKPIPKGREKPSGPPSARPDDGFGTDWKNPTTGMEGGPIGRNMPALPRHLRDPHGKPDVQMVAQHLLAREGFKPAASQLNVLAASWIQAMVHDWIGHYDGDEVEALDEGLDDEGESLCPFARSPFRFKKTKTETINGKIVSPRSVVVVFPQHVYDANMITSWII